MLWTSDKQQITGLILLCYTCATISEVPVGREERKKQNLVWCMRQEMLPTHLRIIKGNENKALKELKPKCWPCLGRQLSVFFSALLLIHLLSLCLLQTALHHLLCSALVKNDSASHLWKCLPGLALLLPYFSTKPAKQPCFSEWESSISAKTPSLSAVKE